MSKLPPWIMSADGRMIYTPSGDDPWEPQLTPGADLAKRRGCTCSRLDNKWGEGIEVREEYSFEGVEGFVHYDTIFSIQPGCPLHDTRQREEDQRGTAPDSAPRPVAGSDENNHQCP